MKAITKRIPALAFLCIVLFILAPIGSFPFPNEPDGFGGIKWGSELSGLKGMVFLKTETGYYGSIEIFKKTVEELKAGDAPLESVEYGFWKGKLANVALHTRGLENWNALKKYSFDAFGPGYLTSKTAERFVWRGEVTILILRYEEGSKKGLLHMCSREVFRLQKECE